MEGSGPPMKSWARVDRRVQQFPSFPFPCRAVYRHGGGVRDRPRRPESHLAVFVLLHFRVRISFAGSVPWMDQGSGNDRWTVPPGSERRRTKNGVP